MAYALKVGTYMYWFQLEDLDGLVIQCNCCNKVSHGFDSVEDASNMLNQIGWEHPDANTSYCPSCASKKGYEASSGDTKRCENCVHWTPSVCNITNAWSGLNDCCSKFEEKPLGEPKVSTIREDCKYYRKDPKASHPNCIQEYLSAQLYSCGECAHFEESSPLCQKCKWYREQVYCKVGEAVSFDRIKCCYYEEGTNSIQPSMDDKINHPLHYAGVKIKGVDIECVDVIEALGLGYHLGNAFKYLWRAGRKTEDPKEDLQKAVWYLTRRIEQ